MKQAGHAIAPGAIIAGKYRVESVLGRGGMGIVVAAMHVQLEQRVAIKLLLQDSFDASTRERFAREARAASKIRSEHVAHVLDVGELDSGHPYIVMEYLAGEDLARRLRIGGALPVVEAVSYVLQACEALVEAHVAGIVHRDLKPANVFLARRADGSVTVKLLDFGVSKVSAGGPEGVITAGETIVGSPAYMPPEQIRSSRAVDARGDLWSLGIMLFELVAGKLPFRADTLPELCVRILESPTPDLAEMAPDTPKGLGDVLRRCLEKNPDARFASLAELAAALEPFGPPEGRISVERVSRILGAPPPTSRIPRTTHPDSATLKLQEAATLKSHDAPLSSWLAETPAPEAMQTAHSVVSPSSARGPKRGSSVAAFTGVVVLALVVAAGLALRESRRAPETDSKVTEMPPSRRCRFPRRRPWRASSPSRPRARRSRSSPTKERR